MPNNVLLLATGNTVSYAAEDDGDLKRGVVKSFTTLTSGQYSGTTNITSGGQTEIKSNNCILDNNTGLMWARYQTIPPMGPPIGKYTDGDGSMLWDGWNGAGQYIVDLNLANFAGYNDWRLPNIFELLTLVEYLDAGADLSAEFDGVYNSLWSSTTQNGGTVMYLLVGTGEVFSLTGTPRWVLPVRAGITSLSSGGISMPRVRIGH